MNKCSELDRYAIVNFLLQCTVPPDQDKYLREWLRSDIVEIRVAALHTIGNGKRLRKERWALNALSRAHKPGNPPEVIAEAKNVLRLIRPDLYPADEQNATP
jgi:hypothetical protein